MPRSVNAVASRERRKKLMKHAKGYFGRRKNVWTVVVCVVKRIGMCTNVIYCFNAHFSGTAHNSQGNFTAICDQ